MVTRLDLDAYVLDAGGDLFWCTGKKYWGLQRGGDNAAEELLYRCNEFDGDTIVGITNFDDDRAKMYFEKLKQFAGEKGLEFAHDETLLSIQVGKHKRTFVQGQKIGTNKGHIHIVGAKRNIDYRFLDDVLMSAHENHNALIFAPHVFSKYGLSPSDANKHKELLDGICSWDGYTSDNLFQQREKLAYVLDIPTCATSNSSRVKSVLSTAMDFDEVDVSSLDNFKSSIRDNLRNPQHGFVKGSNGLFEPYRHMASVVLWLGCNKVGLMKRKTN